MLLPQYFRRRREDLGLSQQALADRVHVSKAYISAIETGTESTLSRSSLLQRFAETLGVSPNQLISRRQKKVRKLCRNKMARPHSLGAILTKARCELKLSQQELSGVSGVSSQFISRLETGRYAKLSAAKAQKLSAALHVSIPAQFIKGICKEEE